MLEVGKRYTYKGSSEVYVFERVIPAGQILSGEFDFREEGMGAFSGIVLTAEELKDLKEV